MAVKNINKESMKKLNVKLAAVSESKGWEGVGFQKV